MSHQFAFATASLNREKEKGLDLRGGIGMVNARFEIGTIEKHTIQSDRKYLDSKSPDLGGRPRNCKYTSERIKTQII
jgi:hypothetical protein